jgi:riboflavin kinase/FMN adenylyltransferase
MRLVRVPDDPLPARPPEVVATIGNFDGVHRGHRALIARLIERAAQLGLQSAVVTFDPHPLRVIRPDLTLGLLSTADEKGELFQALGVDHLLVWRFDAALQQTGAAAFLEALDRRVHLRRLLYGPGFALGRKREGTPDVIAALGARMGFAVEEVSPFADSADGVLSSTAIRSLIAAGEVERAARALGRAPTLTGVVVPGERVGRTLGYPTANLALADPLAVPADGVYAGWAEVAPFTPAARRYPAAISIGPRPQFDGPRRVVEAYLLDFDGDLYGQPLRLHVIARLRGQERFADVPALVQQIGRDVAQARAILESGRSRSLESHVSRRASVSETVAPQPTDSGLGTLNLQPEP